MTTIKLLERKSKVNNLRDYTGPSPRDQAAAKLSTMDTVLLADRQDGGHPAISRRTILVHATDT